VCNPGSHSSYQATVIARAVGVTRQNGDCGRTENQRREIQMRIGRKPSELIVPREVLEDSTSVEILRAWIANGGLVCSLCPTTWDDTGSWGIALADLARHVANAVHEHRGDDPRATTKRIQELFNAELDSPTETPSGYFPPNDQS